MNERDSEDESPFQKLHRHTSIGRESDTEEPRFAMHRLRTTRPIKKMSQDKNDSGSSGEDDDEDGFELLTAENLFSTLLSRVCEHIVKLVGKLISDNIFLQFVLGSCIDKPNECK